MSTPSIRARKAAGPDRHGLLPIELVILVLKKTKDPRTLATALRVDRRWFDEGIKLLLRGSLPLTFGTDGTEKGGFWQNAWIVHSRWRTPSTQSLLRIGIGSSDRLANYPGKVQSLCLVDLERRFAWVGESVPRGSEMLKPLMHEDFWRTVQPMTATIDLGIPLEGVTSADTISFVQGILHPGLRILKLHGDISIRLDMMEDICVSARN